MGLLDSITSSLGKSAEGLKEQALNSALQGILGKNADLLKGFDMAKATELLDFFKKNGVPDTKEEIQELISKFTKK